MKFNRNYDKAVIHSNFCKTDIGCKVLPNLSLSPKEILERSQRGTLPAIQHSGQYDVAEDIALDAQETVLDSSLPYIRQSRLELDAQGINVSRDEVRDLLERGGVKFKDKEEQLIDNKQVTDVPKDDIENKKSEENKEDKK